jgi:hypothetical protein
VKSERKKHVQRPSVFLLSYFFPARCMAQDEKTKTEESEKRFAPPLPTIDAGATKNVSFTVSGITLFRSVVVRVRAAGSSPHLVACP